MKHIVSKLLKSAVLIASVLFATELNGQTLAEQLIKLPSVRKVERMAEGPFAAKYLVWFEQPVSYTDPSAGTFLQRVFVGEVSRDSSSVIVTEGYNADYAARERYRDEISGLFNLNNIVVEHRFFYPSAPENIDWKYLTAENEANDLHRIVTQFKTVFPGKWISTGISKGGQNCAIYRAFFPDDVDISVPYVGPFCKRVEDGRHEPFLAKKAGSESDRAALLAFQKEVLGRRSTLQPLFEEFCNSQGYRFRLPIAEIFDYTVLEFPFAFWQWGRSVESLPACTASDKELLAYLIEAAGPDYFETESPHAPFFVMAAKELGYYGYDTKPLKGLLTIKNAEGYIYKIFLPEDFDFKFDKTLSKKMQKFLKTNECNMLFIYGEFDPWSAVRAGDRHSDTNHIFIDHQGSHRSRIRTFDEPERNEIISILSGWLYE